MKKVALLLLTILICLNGCAPSVQLSKRAIVQTLGIDFTNGEYVATMALYGPAGTSSESISIIIAKGKTLTTLFTEASVAQGKQLFLGNLRLIVLGHSLAQHGIGEVISFLSTHQHLSPSTDVMACKGDAAKLLEEKGVAVSLLDSLITAQKTGELPKITVLDLLAKQRDHIVPILIATEQKNAPPVVESNNSASQSSHQPTEPENESTSAKKIESDGSMLISEGRYRFWLNSEATRGYNWFLHMRKIAIIETDNPLTAAAVKNAENIITSGYADDKIVFHIDTNIRSDLLEMSQETSESMIIGVQEQLIKNEIDAFFTKVYRQGYDPLELAARLSSDELEFAGGKENALKHARYDIRVKCNLENNEAA